MSISELYKIFNSSSGISIDSRSILNGNLFFGINGSNFNGNKFAIEALKKGAKYSIIDEYQKEVITNNKLILIDDVIKCLQDLANHHRRILNTKIIAITGSNGKTTTKELIKTVLQKKYKICATKENYNNHIGVPLTVLNLSKDTDIGIIEMGANHKGEIENLCKIAMPNWGYVTNFGKAHLEGFNSLEGVIEGKSELYNFLNKNDGEILINSNDKIQIKKTKNFKKKSFGNAKNCDYVFESIKTNNEIITIKNNNYIYSSSIYGKYNIDNISSAIAFGKIFKISENLIQESLESFRLMDNRSQIIKKEKTIIILDAYNANPSSMNEALKAFIKNKISKNSCVILGDMLELGKYSNIEHKKIISKCLNKDIPYVFLVGEIFAETGMKSSKILNFKNVNELILYFKTNKLKFDKILIKGSRELTLEKIVDSL